MHARVIAAAVACTAASVAHAEIITITAMGRVLEAEGGGATAAPGLSDVGAGDSFMYTLQIDSDAIGSTSGSVGNVFGFSNAVVGGSFSINGNDYSSIFFGTGDAARRSSSLEAVNYPSGRDDVLRSDLVRLEDVGGLESKYTLSQDWLVGSAFDDFVAGALGTNWVDSLAAGEPARFAYDLFDPSTSSFADGFVIYLDVEKVSARIGMDNPAVPLPSVAGLGLVGLTVVGSRRRRAPAR